MVHCLPPQPDCTSAWLHAAKFVDSQPRHEAYNVLIDVVDPVLDVNMRCPVVSIVERLMKDYGKSVRCVANTIFPNELYRRHGMPDFIEEFHAKVLPKVRKNTRWSGYYFERMTVWPTAKGQSVDQLSDIIERIRDPQNGSRNRFEIAIYDPARDIDNSPYGGQCLSHLSFKIIDDAGKKLALTAMYRNHFYIEKLLGNLIGLGWLMDFVAKESGIGIGPLTVLSTHAKIDQPHGLPRLKIVDLLGQCSDARS